MAVARQRIKHYRRRDFLRWLRAFCRVARLGCITLAAESVGFSQPAVSRHVRNLEDDLKAVLLEGDISGVSLTPAGRCLYELADPLVQGMDNLAADLAKQIDDMGYDRLEVAASMIGAASVVPSYVRAFRDQYPEIPVRVRNCPLSDGVKLLLADEVDVVLGENDPYPEGALKYRELLSYVLVLIACVDHPLAGRETVTPQEAAAWPAIVPPTATYNRAVGADAARQLCAGTGAVIEVDDWEVAKRYVEAGLGIAIVPSICVNETDPLSVISLEKYCPARSYGAFTRSDKALTPNARRLLRLMIADFPDPPLPRHGLAQQAASSRRNSRRGRR